MTDGMGLSRRRVAALGLAALAVPGSSLAATDPQGEAVETFADRMRRLNIPVWLEGRGPFRFLVDTGANRSVIAQEVAEALPLPPGPLRTVHGIAGPRPAPSAVVGRVQVGARIKRRMAFSLLPRQAVGADGLLGLEWLNNQRLVLDFDESRLVIEPSRPRSLFIGASDARYGDGGVATEARLVSGRLSLVRVGLGGEAISAFIDSGSYCTIGNPALLALARAHGLVGRDWGETEIVGATGDRLAGRRFSLRSLKVGGLRFRNVPVVFGQVHTFGLWGAADEPMILIGMDVLRIFRSVALDYANREVVFQVAKAS